MLFQLCKQVVPHKRLTLPQRESTAGPPSWFRKESGQTGSIDILPALSSCPSEPQPLSENFMSGPFPPPPTLQYPSAVLLQHQAPLTPNHAFHSGSDIPSTSGAPTSSSSYWTLNNSTSNLSLRISIYAQFLLPCFEHSKGRSLIKLRSPMSG